MRSLASIVGPPLLCLGILGGIVLENRTHTKPADAEPFHAVARKAVEEFPINIGDWSGHDEKLPTAAIQLLRPNVHLCRTFINTSRPGMGAVSLLIVQCRDPNDMSGHYPPNCRPQSGEPLVYQEGRDWTIPGLPEVVYGKEYHFEAGTILHPRRVVIYNFFVLPGRGTAAEMADVRRASGDYQRRHFGAAQVQVLFPQDMDRPARDEVFATLLRGAPGLLKTLDPSGI